MTKLPKGFKHTAEGVALNKPRPEGRPIATSFMPKKKKLKKAKRK